MFILKALSSHNSWSRLFKARSERIIESQGGYISAVLCILPLAQLDLAGGCGVVVGWSNLAASAAPPAAYVWNVILTAGFTRRTIHECTRVRAAPWAWASALQALAVRTDGVIGRTAVGPSVAGAVVGETVLTASFKGIALLEASWAVVLPITTALRVLGAVGWDAISSGALHPNKSYKLLDDGECHRKLCICCV